MLFPLPPPLFLFMIKSSLKIGYICYLHSPTNFTMTSAPHLTIEIAQRKITSLVSEANEPIFSLISLDFFEHLTLLTTLSSKFPLPICCLPALLFFFFNLSLDKLFFFFLHLPLFLDQPLRSHFPRISKLQLLFTCSTHPSVGHPIHSRGTHCIKTPKSFSLSPPSLLSSRLMCLHRGVS